MAMTKNRTIFGGNKFPYFATWAGWYQVGWSFFDKNRHTFIDKYIFEINYYQSTTFWYRLLCCLPFFSCHSTFDSNFNVTASSLIIHRLCLLHVYSSSILIMLLRESTNKYAKNAGLVTFSFLFFTWTSLYAKMTNYRKAMNEHEHSVLLSGEKRQHERRWRWPIRMKLLETTYKMGLKNPIQEGFWA